MKRVIAIILLISVVTKVSSHPKARDVEVIQNREGNFALRYSQQPGPMFAFGQNIVDPNDVMTIFFLDGLIPRCNQERSVSFFPYLLYGISDKASIILVLPFDWSKSNGCTETTIPDVYVQGEYAYYSKETETSMTQMTIMAGVSAPTAAAQGSYTVSGFGPGIFLGGTQSYLSINWYAYASQGVQLQLERDHAKSGNQYYYQFGLARNLGNIRGCIFMGMVELIGALTTKDRVENRTVRNTGGNVIFIAPSLYLSTEHFYIQPGCGFIVSERLSGHQTKNRFIPAIDIGWTFA